MLNTSVYLEENIPTQRERFWRHFRSNNLAMFGLWNLGVIALITLTATFIAPHDPIAQSSVLLQPPSWAKEGAIEYFLGTDDLGRDILSRLLIGSQVTIGSAVLITIIAAIVGSIIGALAGMTRGLLSSILNHLLDVVMSIPSLLLALIFIAFLGTGDGACDAGYLLGLGAKIYPFCLSSHS
ncbi:peptide transport system permease protein sapC [Vibrio sp. JCM 19236]|nr:peptide transport system permease protein sapC [Vibrio sp. JCM 19236]